MTIKELRSYRAVCAELNQTEAQLKASKMSVKDAVQSASKFPYSLHSVPVEGAVYDEELLRRRDELISEKKRLRDFVRSIGDYRVRRALEIYCIDPLDADMEPPNWEDVADALGDPK